MPTKLQRHLSPKITTESLALWYTYHVLKLGYHGKAFDKRDAFPFFIVCMPYIDINIPESIFHSTSVVEFLRIARSSFLYKEFH